MYIYDNIIDSKENTLLATLGKIFDTSGRERVTSGGLVIIDYHVMEF